MSRSRGALARVAHASVAIASALLVLCAAILLLTAPWFTNRVVAGLDVGGRTGLAEPDAISLAEQVRAYVGGSGERELPSSVGGREGFDARAKDHLQDVRRLIAAVRVIGVIALSVVGLAVPVLARRGAGDVLRGALRDGALALTTLVLLATATALLGFDRFFTFFHSVFFAEGTWVFASDSLLIQLFPVEFWQTAAAALGAMVLAGAGLLGILALAMRGPAADGR